VGIAGTGCNDDDDDDDDEDEDGSPAGPRLTVGR
jgi:hypothetical protein